MSVALEAVRGSWRGARDDARATITLVFVGHMDETAGIESAAFLVRALAPRPFAPSEWQLLCDLRRITSHDGAARQAWQHVLQPVRRSLSQITVVGGTAVVRMAAAAFGLYLGIPVRGVTSDDRLDDPEDSPPGVRARG